jgi:hypothetical protein
MPDYIQFSENKRIINKWISVDPSTIESLPNIIQVERSIAESITKFHLVDNGVVRLMTQLEKDTLLAEETQQVINTENQRIQDLDLKIDNLPTMTLQKIDTAIDNITNIAGVKTFLKKQCRYILKVIAK